MKVCVSSHSLATHRCQRLYLHIKLDFLPHSLPNGLNFTTVALSIILRANWRKKQHKNKIEIEDWPDMALNSLARNKSPG